MVYLGAVFSSRELCSNGGKGLGILYWGRARLLALSCHFLARDSFILLVIFSSTMSDKGRRKSGFQGSDLLLDSLPTGEGRVGSRLL